MERLLKSIGQAILGLIIGGILLSIVSDSVTADKVIIFMGLPSGWSFISRYIGHTYYVGGILDFFIGLAIEIAFSTIVGWVVLPINIVRGLIEICIMFSQKDRSENTYYREQQSDYSDRYSYNWGDDKQSGYEDRSEDRGESGREGGYTGMLQEALCFYNLSLPFSMADLKKRRNLLIKKYHEDNGGTKEASQKTNDFYEVLKVYAS